MTFQHELDDVYKFCTPELLICTTLITQVTFQHKLDVYEFCTPELQKALDGPRAAYRAHQDRQLQKARRERRHTEHTRATESILTTPYTHR